MATMIDMDKFFSRSRVVFLNSLKVLAALLVCLSVFFRCVALFFKGFGR